MNSAQLVGRVNGIRIRDLPSGGTLTTLDVVSVDDGPLWSAPVECFHDHPPIVDGDIVAVSGKIVRRFFRAGGVTQARTIVEADYIRKAPW